MAGLVLFGSAGPSSALWDRVVCCLVLASRGDPCGGGCASASSAIDRARRTVAGGMFSREREAWPSWRGSIRSRVFFQSGCFRALYGYVYFWPLRDVGCSGMEGAREKLRYSVCGRHGSGPACPDRRRRINTTCLPAGIFIGHPDPIIIPEISKQTPKLATKSSPNPVPMPQHIIPNPDPASPPRVRADEWQRI